MSIVSHGHGAMVERLIGDLLDCRSVGRVVVTLNIPEILALDVLNERVTVLKNVDPKGFAANHNAAFALCETPLFCPLNPDIKVNGDPFEVLVERLADVPDAALVAPLIVTPDGKHEDNFRRFPTLWSLAKKAVMGQRGAYSISPGSGEFFPEWAAGMFMLFRSSAYRELRGFDEAYYLYYEDVDICVRAWRSGMKVMGCPEVAVVHDARRESRRNLQFMRWHGESMLRYFWRYLGRLPCGQTAT